MFAMEGFAAVLGRLCLMVALTLLAPDLISKISTPHAPWAFEDSFLWLVAIVPVVFICWLAATQLMSLTFYVAFDLFGPDKSLTDPTT